MPLGANGAMRLTTAYYFTPSGNSIQGEGITPDILVEQIRFDKSKKINSRRRSEGDLRGSLANPNGKSDGKESKDDKKDAKKPEESANDKQDGSDDNKKDEDDKEDEEPVLTTAQDDYQLNYAINLLHGMAIARNID
ncbi:MAG: hypothetical protein COB49_07740 [Alphaproteobacteria bacterium]|nr:MAG: hypothetical protein COB49_07740 [Alphaproteobacteria bacterium]